MTEPVLFLERPDGKGPRIALDPASVLDLRGVWAGGANWAPGLEIVDDGDPRIWHSLQGFLFTAGPEHFRHPEPLPSGDGRYPLHGSLAGHPARNIQLDQGLSACSADVPVSLADGGRATLYRRWEIGSDGMVCLSDRLVNTGDQAFAPMLLYHMNIGGRLLDRGTRLAGDMLDGGGFPWDFRDDPGGVFCVAAAAQADGFARISLGPVSAAGDLTLEVAFDSASLPYLQIWRCRREGVNVLGIEPCSHRWEKRAMLEAAGEMPLLLPGETRHYALRFRFYPKTDRQPR